MRKGILRTIGVVWVGLVLLWIYMKGLPSIEGARGGAEWGVLVSGVMIFGGRVYYLVRDGTRERIGVWRIIWRISFFLSGMVLVACLGWYGLMVSFAYIMNQGCALSYFGEKTSPNGQAIATVYEIDCGASTSFNCMVALRHFGDDFEPFDKDERVFAVSRDLFVDVEWNSDTHLTIFYPEEGNAWIRETRWNDVSVSYVGCAWEYDPKKARRSGYLCADGTQRDGITQNPIWCVRRSGDECASGASLPPGP